MQRNLRKPFIEMHPARVFTSVICSTAKEIMEICSFQDIKIKSGFPLGQMGKITINLKRNLKWQQQKKNKTLLQLDLKTRKKNA